MGGEQDHRGVAEPPARAGGPGASPGEGRPAALGPGWTVGVAAAVAAVAWAAGAAPALAPFAGAAAALAVACHHRRHSRRPVPDTGDALREIADALARVRRGLVPICVQERGPRELRTVIRRLNSASLVLAERRREACAELAVLEASYERVRSVLHSLVTPIVVVDDRGRIVMANPAARTTLDLLDHRVEGRPIAGLVESGLQSAVTEGLHRVAQSELPSERIAGVSHGDRIYDLEFVRVVPEPDVQEPACAVVMADVTDRFEIARLKDQFLSSVSHELRTPLTCICAYAEIVKGMDSSDLQWHEFVEIIVDQAHRLTRLVDNLLDFSSVESGHVEWAVDAVSTATVITEITASYRPVLSQVQIELTTECERDARVVMDPARLRQVLGNLLDNAIKFGRPGGNVLVRSYQDDGHVFIEVHDDGPGLDPGDRDRVFEKFRQLGSTLTHKAAGTGLGLALCREILAAFDGTITCADSRLGGACFRLRLPIANQKPLVRLAGPDRAR